MRARSRILLALVVAGCATDEPTLSTVESGLTAAASDTCNQGVGRGFCVQVPPFEVSSLSRWVVDGSAANLEYAGATTLPFVTDHRITGNVAEGTRVTVSGRVTFQRVSYRPALGTAKDYLYVYFDDVPLAIESNVIQPKVRLAVDFDRFADDTGSAGAGDIRYTVDLSGATALTAQTITYLNGTPVWWTAAVPTGATFAAGGCTRASVVHALCRGELRIPLPSTITTPPGPNLDPGIGVYVKGVGTTGMLPEQPSGEIAAADYARTAWQTLLFSTPRGIDTSFMTWNVRRGLGLFELQGFDAVPPETVGEFLANNDVVALQEGWDAAEVHRILDGANAMRERLHLPPFALYSGPEFERDRASVIAAAVSAFGADSHGGLWIMTAHSVAAGGYAVFSDSACRGEDCLKAKGVQWLRVYLQDLTHYDPECLKYAESCPQPPSGDDFVDVFNAHLQASAPLACVGADWAEVKLAIQTALSAIPIVGQIAAALATITTLIETDLNCYAVSDEEARARQLAQMNAFIAANAATDRASIVMGDFNIDGKTRSGAEYKAMLTALGITASTTGDDRISTQGAGGFDIQHGDLVNERGDVDAAGTCTGTDIGASGGTVAPACTYAGKLDGAGRLDYVLVRPPVPRKFAVDDPRWYVLVNPDRDVWSSPFPSLSGQVVWGPPGRLSDHKPVRAGLSLARLDTPTPYKPGWRHRVDMRVTSYDATGMDDCWMCGAVDPFAKLTTKITPGSTSSTFTTTECTDNQAATSADACMSNWTRTRTHTPPDEVSVEMNSHLYDDDNTSDTDGISDRARSLWTYGDATYAITFFPFGGPEWPGDYALNLAAVPISLCVQAGGTFVCHGITLTPLGPGE